jgi:hypothetical protein
MRDAYGEDAPALQRLPQRGVIEGQIPSQGVEGKRLESR